MLLGGTFIAFGRCLWFYSHDDRPRSNFRLATSVFGTMKVKSIKKLVTLAGLVVLTLSFMPDVLAQISGGETCPQICADVRNSCALKCFSPNWESFFSNCLRHSSFSACNDSWTSKNPTTGLSPAKQFEAACAKECDPALISCMTNCFAIHHR
jgi:hypothetical protein